MKASPMSIKSLQAWCIVQLQMVSSSSALLNAYAMDCMVCVLKAERNRSNSGYSRWKRTGGTYGSDLERGVYASRIAGRLLLCSVLQPRGLSSLLCLRPGELEVVDVACIKSCLAVRKIEPASTISSVRIKTAMRCHHRYAATIQIGISKMNQSQHFSQSIWRSSAEA